MFNKTFPSPEVLRRFPFGLAGIGVIPGTDVYRAIPFDSIYVDL